MKNPPAHRLVQLGSLAAGSWTTQVTQAAGNPAATISYTFTPSTPLANFARLKVTQN